MGNLYDHSHAVEAIKTRKLGSPLPFRADNNFIVDIPEVPFPAQAHAEVPFPTQAFPPQIFPTQFFNSLTLSDREASREANLRALRKQLGIEGSKSSFEEVVTMLLQHGEASLPLLYDSRHRSPRAARRRAKWPRRPTTRTCACA